MRAEIKLLHQRTRRTTVYVTHDQVEAMTLGDRIAVMKAGVLQQFGTPDDIYSRPATRFVAEFIGSPSMNMLNASLANEGLHANGQALPLAGQRLPQLLGLPQRDWIYGLRPEAVSFADAGLPGRISMVEPTGPETYAKVETEAGVVVARVPGRLERQVGDHVHLAWDASQVHLFDGKTEERLAEAA
jgi:multiple sugar transport system ATP-binding protein